MARNLRRLVGTHRTAAYGAKLVGDADTAQQADVVLRLRSRVGSKEWEAKILAMCAMPPHKRNYLSRDELARERGVRPKDLEAVEQFSHVNHLTIVESSALKRTVRLSGSVADLNRAFGVRLKMYEAPTGKYRGRSGHIYLPEHLVGIVEGVFGLDNRRVTKSGVRNRPAAAKSKQAKNPTKKPSQSAQQAFSVTELAKLYQFPADADGSGQCIGLIELNTIDQDGKIMGGGYSNSDIKKYFSRDKIDMPSICAVGVGGGRNAPGADQSADFEVVMDIEVAGAAAPGTKLAVYFAPNTDAGFLDAVGTALFGDMHKPNILSISWGNPEDEATDQFLHSMNDMFLDAAALGVTICCEAGDYGSSDLADPSKDDQPHVEFPASSPFVLACGGTQIQVQNGVIVSESVWNAGDRAGGGGISSRCARPAYQSGLKMPLSPEKFKGRGLPDVAANAADYIIISGGKQILGRGTSAVAPLWAALIARINQALEGKGGNPVGFLNPLLYRDLVGRGAFRDIVIGTNDLGANLGKYSAQPGWDACTGLGSPDGEVLMKLLLP